MDKICVRVLSNAGYSKDQVKGVTLEELQNFITDLLEYYDKSTEVVTINDGNLYGAKYGKIYLEIAEEDEED